MSKKNQGPKNTGLAADIINEGKAAAAGKAGGLDQGAIKTDAMNLGDQANSDNPDANANLAKTDAGTNTPVNAPVTETGANQDPVINAETQTAPGNAALNTEPVQDPPPPPVQEFGNEQRAQELDQNLQDTGKQNEGNTENLTGQALAGELGNEDDDTDNDNSMGPQDNLDLQCVAKELAENPGKEAEILAKLTPDQIAALQELEQDAEQYAQAQADKEKAEAEAEEKIVKKFGRDYVHAKKADGTTTYFTAMTWNRLGGANNTDGWTQVVKTPPEVAALKK